MSRVSEVTGIPLLELHQQITWQMYSTRHSSGSTRHPSEVIRHPFDIFRDILVGHVEEWLKSHPVFPVLLENIQKRLHVPVYKLRAKIDVMCWTESGVEGIRAALLAGKSISPEVNIRLEKSPTYILSMETTEKEKGLQLLSNVCYTINETILPHGGKIVVQVYPYVQSNEEVEEPLEEEDE